MAERSTTGFDRWWRFAATALLIAIVAGVGALVWQQRGSGMHEIEMRTDESSRLPAYVGGLVIDEGAYRLAFESSLSDLLGAAGGLSVAPERAAMRVYVIDASAAYSGGAQRVNLNTAEAWLLEALPGIGKTRAEAIVAYRTANGIFKSIDELLEVPGIGPATVEGLREKATVLPEGAL